MYRTTDGKGQRMYDLNNDQISKMAVHTKETEVCKHVTNPHMRRSAVRLNGELSVVWTTDGWETQSQTD